MKKTLLLASCVAMLLASCNQKKCQCDCSSCQNCEYKQDSTAEAETAVPEYEIVENTQVDLSEYAQDEDGYYVLYDGTSLK